LIFINNKSDPFRAGNTGITACLGYVIRAGFSQSSAYTGALHIVLYELKEDAMKDDYAPRTCVPLQPETTLETPSEMPELVHMNESAMLVFTDFARTRPVTTSVNTAIDEALRVMKTAGVRLLLVTDDEGAVIGQVGVDEILGDEPIKLQQTTRMDRSEIMVSAVMMPLSQIRVMEWSHMKDAKVGHIVATLHQMEKRHLLVVEAGRIRGLFSASQITRQTGREVMETALPAHSFAEIVHNLS
jgi:CBS domain-containing protein